MLRQDAKATLDRSSTIRPQFRLDRLADRHGYRVRLEGMRAVAMNVIESTRNEKVKGWRLLHRRKGRAEAGLFLAEGPHLVEEAVRYGIAIEEIVLREGAERPAGTERFPVTMVAGNVMRAVCESEAPQGVAAVCRLPPDDGLPEAKGVWLLLDAVQDPGNVGALIRTADAAGCSCVVCGEGCADAFGGKALRASQGSVFHLPVIRRELRSAIGALEPSGMRVLASAADGDAFDGMGRMENFALVMGNEGAGIAEHIAAACDARVAVPIRGRAESLNVAVAAGVLLFALGGARP